METSPQLEVTDEAVLAGLHGWNEQYTPPLLSDYKIEDVRYMRNALETALPVVLADRAQ